MESYDYVVLGAGLGGLSTAACLTRLGHRVAVVEKHYLAGGCCHTFEMGSYRFCADVHYISDCQPEHTIGRFLGFIEREVPFNSLDPDCIDRVVTPDVDFRIPLGWERFRARLKQTFPAEARGIDCYCDVIRRIHEEVTRLSTEVRWYERRWSDWLLLPKYWFLYGWQGKTLQDLYDFAGLSRPVQAILAGQSGDYALPPAEIALLSHAALVWSYSEGAFYPKHHFQHLVDTIVEAIRDRGGQVLLESCVEHIDVAAGKVQSIRVAGREFQASRGYISDMDPKLTVELMHEGAGQLGRRELERLTRYEYSASAFNIYLGLKPEFDPLAYGIGNWNVWYYPQGDLNGSYARQLRGDMTRPWLFLSCPTMKSDEPGMAPPGDHVLEVATVCPYAPFQELASTDRAKYRTVKHEVYEQLMASLRDLIPDVDQYIRKRVSGSPTTTEFYLGQPEGNIYGARLIPRQVGLHRMGYRTALPNLMLVGATAGYPSVPGVINNGMDVTELLTGVDVRTVSPVRRRALAAANALPEQPASPGAFERP